MRPTPPKKTSPNIYKLGGETAILRGSVDHHFKSYGCPARALQGDPHLPARQGSSCGSRRTRLESGIPSDSFTFRSGDGFPRVTPLHTWALHWVWGKPSRATEQGNIPGTPFPYGGIAYHTAETAPSPRAGPQKGEPAFFLHSLSKFS